MKRKHSRYGKQILLHAHAGILGWIQDPETLSILCKVVG